MEKIAAFLLLVSLVLNTQGGKDCQGDLCLKDLELKLYAKGVSNGLAYMDTGTDVTSKARDVLKVCSSNAELETTALATFPSCTGPMNRICTMAKRKWLKNDDNKQTVADSELILKSVAGLGGESIVNECLQIPEEYEEYEYYDYAYYDDYYDYLEETDNLRRGRRDAGKNGKPRKGNGRKPGKGNGGRKNKTKGSKKNKKKTRRAKKNKKTGRSTKGKDKKNGRSRKGKDKKKGRSNGRKSDKKVKPKKKKGAKKDRSGNKKSEKKEKKKEKLEMKQAKANKKEGRKHTNNKPQDPENDAKIAKKLAELGLKALPSKDTLNGLTCVQQKIKALLKQCAEGKLNQ